MIMFKTGQLAFLPNEFSNITLCHTVQDRSAFLLNLMNSLTKPYAILFKAGQLAFLASEFSYITLFHTV